MSHGVPLGVRAPQRAVPVALPSPAVSAQASCQHLLPAGPPWGSKTFVLPAQGPVSPRPCPILLTASPVGK